MCSALASNSLLCLESQTIRCQKVTLKAKLLALMFNVTHLAAHAIKKKNSIPSIP